MATVLAADKDRSGLLLTRQQSDAVMVWRDGIAITVAEFAAEVEQVAARLPASRAAVNLAEDRYAFMVLFCALLLRGQTNLLPASRTTVAIDEAMQAIPDAYRVDESWLGGISGPTADGLRSGLNLTTSATVPALIAYTSGSTGVPQPHPRGWAQVCAGHAGVRRRLHSYFGASFSVVATVHPQHMFGWEFSVLLPLHSEVSVHSGRPLFPAEIATALAQVPAPRVLVTTPLHLRALLAAEVSLPPLTGVLSATAPLDGDLAAEAEARLAAPVYEIFGSTETCAIASRRTVAGAWWQPMEGVRVQPQPDGCVVTAPQLEQPLRLGDVIESEPSGGDFRLLGRQQDLLEIAGKRMSLADLNRRLLAIPGVLDGVVFQQQQSRAGGVRRIGAVVVAPTLDEAQLMQRLREVVDPVFLPRPLKRVDALPRNDIGKLPWAALMQLWQQLLAGRPGS